MPEPDSGPRRVRVIMFCSTTQNIGQTTTVRNTALALAESGRRVLVVDARRTDAGVLRQLQEVATIHLPPEGSAPSPLPEPVVCEVAVGNLVIHVIDLAGPSSLESLPARDFAARAPAYAGFDDVLIDTPVPRTAEQFSALARLPHTLVTCFTLDPVSIDSASALARSVRERAGRAVDVVAVGIQADHSMSGRLRLAHDRVRTAFEEFTPGRAADYVEISYDPLHGQRHQAEPELRTGDFRWRQPGFRQLAAALDRPPPPELRRVAVFRSPRHTAWAEWISGRLSGSGIQVTAQPLDAFTGDPPDPRSMVLLLPASGPGGGQDAPPVALSHPNVRMVLVDDEAPPLPISQHEQIDLRWATEAQAVDRLRRGLQLPDSLPLSGPYRFPRLPDRNNLARRRSRFFGRDQLCENLRRALTGQAARRRPCLLTGPPGIGKSQLALEFCHRFGSAYDTVWWVRAASADSARRSLESLAPLLGVPAETSAAEQLLDRLGSASGGSWLLVYDDVRDPAALTGLLPPGGESRHVLLTSRQPLEEAILTRSVEVPPFSAGESRSLLTAEVPGLPPRQADRAGQMVGHVPLTLQLAAAWLKAEAARCEARNRPRATAVLESARRFTDVFSAVQHGLLSDRERVSLPRVMLEAAISALPTSPGGEIWSKEESGSPALVWLLECCALLAPVGAELALLRSPRMQAALARRHPGSAPEPDGTAETHTLTDAMMVDVALWALDRHGLIEVDFGRPARPVRQHRVLRELVVERMGEAQRKARLRELRALVGGYFPPPGDDADRPLDGRQARQLVSLRLWDDERPQVRQWLLRHLRSLAVTGERQRLLEALEIAEHAEQAWRSQPLSAEYLRLHNLTAQALRNLGRYSEAACHAKTALSGHREALGTGHPRTLLSADSYGAILRADGDFTEARIESHHVVRGITELLGPEHPATAQTEHNLALAEGLSGDYRTALRILQNRIARRHAIGGPDDPEALRMVDTLAFTHRGLGQNRESFRLLKEFLRHGGTQLSAAGPGSAPVNVEIGLAVSERRLGNPSWAWERDARVLRECRARYGEHQIRTLRCRFSLAADLHALGKYDEAVTETGGCLNLLEATLGEDHPYTHLCRIRLGVHLRSAGDPHGGQRAGEDALERLSALLGPAHPWVAAAAAGLAETLVLRGKFDRAAALGKKALECFDELGMTRHPDREAVARNLADTRAQQNSGLSPADAPRRGDIDLELPGL